MGSTGFSVEKVGALGGYRAESEVSRRHLGFCGSFIVDSRNSRIGSTQGGPNSSVSLSPEAPEKTPENSR